MIRERTEKVYRRYRQGGITGGNIFPHLLRKQLNALADERRQIIVSYVYNKGDITLTEAKNILDLKSKSTAYYHIAYLVSTGILRQKTKYYKNKSIVTYELSLSGKKLVELLLDYSLKGKQRKVRTRTESTTSSQIVRNMSVVELSPAETMKSMFVGPISR